MLKRPSGFFAIGRSNKQSCKLIEAMKLLNEIQAEVSGRVAEVAAENGHAVEHKQVLFRLAKP